MPTETSPPKKGHKPNKPEPVEPVQTTEQIVRIPLTELHPFPDHPYGIREDQAMQDTLDSVKQNGVVVPAIVRPCAEGDYEIVAGHRRKLASEQAGFTDMPCIIRNLSDDEAIIQLVDSNAQREDVLPSERAKAYKMRLEAIKRTAGRPRKDLSENAPNNSAHFRSDDEVGIVDGVSGDTVRNIMIVCKAFHARRCLMLYQMAFPYVDIIVCPVLCYNITKDNWYKKETGIKG